jgi:hypothetical protein
MHTIRCGVMVEQNRKKVREIVEGGNTLAQKAYIGMSSAELYAVFESRSLSRCKCLPSFHTVRMHSSLHT